MLEIISKAESNKTISFDSFVFSGGEVHVKLHHHYFPNGCVILARLQSTKDLLELVFVVDALNRIHSTNGIDLIIPYMPGARQDRVCNPGEALSIKIYADIINSLNCDTVEICDPHSDVTPALINNCVLYPIENIIRQVIADCKPDYIISPDAGATKRIYNYLLKIGCEIPVIQCLKKRDTKTGKLSGFQVCNWAEWSQPKSEKLLIIDDICDGGGTFLGLADELKDLHSKNELYLYITHGIFSKGYTDLLSKYDKIYTTNSFIPELKDTSGRIITYDLFI